MADVRDRRNMSSDRLAPDRARHTEHIKQLLRENPDAFEQAVAEESVITGNGDRRVKIPLRTKREPMFRYGFAPDGTGQQDGAQRGQKMNNPYGQVAGQGSGQGQGKNQGPGQDVPGFGPKAGHMPGEDIFGQAELTLNEIAELLSEQYELPDLELKGQGKLKMRTRHDPAGVRRKGSWPRLHRRATVKQHIARKIALGKNTDQRLPYHDDDLRYYGVRERPEPSVNAVFFLVMDTSGSMDTAKKFIARTVCFLITTYLRRLYQDVRFVFISHDTAAYERDEDNFFTKESSGGTMISSGMAKVRALIDERYNPDHWNIYVAHCTDGENLGSDNPKMRQFLADLLKDVNLFAFLEIRSTSSLSQELAEFLTTKNQFAFGIIKEKKDISRILRWILKHDRVFGEVIQ